MRPRALFVKRLALIAASLMLLANASGDTLTFQGGSVHSPDGRYRVWAAPVGDAMKTIAWLSGPGGKRRALMAYERSARVLWPSGSGRVVLLERTLHFATFRAFPLVEGTAPRDRIQGDIVRGMAVVQPRLGTIENREITFGRIAGALCASVEESGLPPGRDEGSFIARHAAFRVDLAKLRATPIARCPVTGTAAR